MLREFIILPAFLLKWKRLELNEEDIKELVELIELS